MNFYKIVSGNPLGKMYDKPFHLTDENREQIKAQYPRLTLLCNQRCPICGSYLISGIVSEWQHDEKRHRTLHTYGRKVICPTCQKYTVEDPWIPDNNATPLTITPNVVGWVKCPNCGKLFSPVNRASWNGERHRTCGQRLTIIGEKAPA